VHAKRVALLPKRHLNFSWGSRHTLYFVNRTPRGFQKSWFKTILAMPLMHCAEEKYFDFIWRSGVIIYQKVKYVRKFDIIAHFKEDLKMQWAWEDKISIFLTEFFSYTVFLQIKLVIKFVPRLLSMIIFHQPQFWQAWIGTLIKIFGNQVEYMGEDPLRSL
jgi:hypothetical protein